MDSEEVLNNFVRLLRKLKVSDKVKVIPNVSKSDLRKILLNSKIYLHPKINEHFGIAIVEAMSCGCIPIVHNSGGPKEFVPQAFRYDNIEEAAKKIDKALGNWSVGMSARISNLADKFSERCFSEKFIASFNSFYEQKMKSC